MTKINEKILVLFAYFSSSNYGCTTYNQNSGSQCECETTDQKESSLAFKLNQAKVALIGCINKCGIHPAVLTHSCRELAKSVVTNNLSLYISDIIKNVYLNMHNPNQISTLHLIYITKNLHKIL